ncbi:hypothetical protein [Fructobacillus fructosus]|uniref:hypothetical protein n=1 Tax=Fructobacillus fructosus TaxID=1631 RepID=UPI002DABC3A9|nr:unnamed protein product [Fructobacillus fructosus]CAK1251573.1 unnamed protein product [Fructobacillus fructosus]CAK1251621.1 unnamed protein product [Fructobacillus fructosus]
MVKKILISVTAVLAIMSLLAFSQGGSLKKQVHNLQMKKQKLKEKKTIVLSSSGDQVLQDQYDMTTKGADKLKTLMAIVLNQDPTKYDLMAPGQVSASAKAYMQRTTGASVDFGNRQNFTVKQVAPADYYTTKPQYLVIGQSGSQNVAYLVDYDPYINEIMAIKKTMIQGDFQDEK